MPISFLPPTFPFYLHLVTELPASINFFLFPSAQITPSISPTPPTTSSSAPSPSTPLISAAPKNPAEAVIRQYAILLFSSVLISLIFALRPIDNTSRQVAATLSIYHVAPMIRAGIRMRRGEISPGIKKKGLGGPVVHFALHGACLMSLGGVVLGWNGN